MKGVSNTKLKSFATITLLSTLLLFSALATTSGDASSITLQYDHNEPDVAYPIAEALAVRFTPPRVWLGTEHICTLYEITGIQLHVTSESWDDNAGFRVSLADQDFTSLKDFPDNLPTEDGWFDVDLADWTDNTRYVDTHFSVVFWAYVLTNQDPWAMLSFDEANLDAGQASALRSYRRTTMPDDSTPYPVWYPIDIKEPYGPGDLMIRVDLEPKTPNSFLPGLIDEIAAAEDMMFQGKAPTVRATLIKKINEAISMFERGAYEAGLNKLKNDIAPKLADPRPTPLADPRPTPATSWLKLYQEGSAPQKQVTSFAVECQAIVQMAQKSASLPGEHERCDFNNDGYDDLVIGVPHENISGKDDAGAVNVLYGSAGGITEEQDQYWRQGFDGVKGDSETVDNFGHALAIGDFNGDNCDDLAIGAPYEDAVTAEQEAIPQVGAVTILHGSSSGLTGVGDQVWWQNSIAQLPVAAEAHDNFGATLASGDFNGDGYDDLAIGVPQETREAVGCGEVDVLYGSSEGLTVSGNQVWSQGTLEGAPESYDYFGKALAVGDFNADGFEDLAVGVPFEDVGDIADAGAVNIIYGSLGGLNVAGNQILYQDEPETLYGVCETEDYFGGSLATGDFDGDNCDDLAVGVPGESGAIDNGFVNVIYGSSSGLTAAGNAGLYAVHYIREECTEFEYFGASLAAGDFDLDGYEDLAVGVPAADIQWESQSYADAGAVYVTYGGSLGLLDPLSDLARWDIWLETDLPYTSYNYDRSNYWFGRTLAIGDFNQDTHCDLAIGVPLGSWAIWDNDQSGMVKVMYATPSGLSASSFNSWWQSKEGVDGDSETDDYFGDSLSGSRWLGIWP